MYRDYRDDSTDNSNTLSVSRPVTYFETIGKYLDYRFHSKNFAPSLNRIRLRGTPTSQIAIITPDQIFVESDNNHFFLHRLSHIQQHILGPRTAFVTPTDILPITTEEFTTSHQNIHISAVAAQYNLRLSIYAER